jgi:formate dehydrogenase alpha subunit
MSVSITFNGIEVKAEPGQTVLEAARANGVYIPTLCYHPKLPPFGGCRLCVVEIENMRGFPTACTAPVVDGMVVRTETEALQALRREILSLILSEHPYTCLVCDRRAACDAFQGTIRKAAVTTGCQYCPENGQCEMPKLVDYLDLKDIPYPITYRGLPVEQEDPFFDRDYNLCILCGRCVRACQEVRHMGVLAFTYRGSQAIVGTAFGRSHLEADCGFCGACVDVCPTGSLADKRGKWEGVPTAIVPSVCPYCSVGCAVDVQVKNGKVIRAVGRDGGSANDGQLCVRGRFGVVDVVHDLARLRAPLVRRNNRLVQVTWDEALDVAAQGLGPHRGDQFALIASAAVTNEEGYALQKFARTTMGSNNVALAADYPYPLPLPLTGEGGPAIRDIRNAASILVIGANLFESHPILGLEIRHALSKGAQLITVDVRQTRLTKRSGLWLQPRVGSDHVLLAGMIRAAAALQGHSIPAVDMDRVAEVTGVPVESIVSAAQLLAQHTPAVILYGSGVTHYPAAAETVQAIHHLAGLAGAGVVEVPGEGNFVGAHDVGLHPAWLPGYRAVSDAAGRAAFEAAWGTPLNASPGRTYQGVLDGIRRGEVKALYLAGEAPAWPELDDLSFLVVQDILSTTAAAVADVILPATTFAEMDGTMTNLEGRVQRLRQAIPPVGLSLPAWVIARDLAQRMGTGLGDYQSAAEVMAEMAALVPAYAGVSPAADGVLRRFATDGGRGAEWSPDRLDGIPRLASDEFPLTLVTERNLFYYHGACLTEQVKGMNLVKQEERLHLSPVDAARLGIANDALVTVVSAYGSTECIAQVNQGMPEGTAFASINHVNGSPLFPALSPGAKACAIRVEVGN